MKRRRSGPGAALRLFARAGLVMLAAASSAGAAEGPARLVKDINQAVPEHDVSSYPNNLSRFGSGLLFTASTRATGFELWKTDGTAAGTRLVKDIFPGPYDSLGHPWAYNRKDFVEVNGVAIFAASDGVHGWEPWRSDGTPEGTSLLKDITPGQTSSLFTPSYGDPYALIWAHARVGGVLVFLADDGVHGFELWRTDGTPGGTYLLQDIQPGTASAFGGGGDYHFTGASVGDRFCFMARNDLTGHELWTTDGTPAGTALVKDVLPGPGSGVAGHFTELNGLLLFSGAWRAGDYELWQTDGTASGTVLVADVIPGSSGSGPELLTRAGPYVFFQSSRDSRSLYRTDGTAVGTMRLHTFHFPSIQFLGDLGGRLLLRSDDGEHGWEPWISDGTPAGTVLLKDIHPEKTFGLLDMVHLGEGRAYFMTDDGAHGRELWRSDGTSDGTRLLADLTPGSGDTNAGLAIRCGAGLLLETDGGLHRIDPATDQVELIAPITRGNEMALLDGRVLLDWDDGVHGSELWTSDGTAGGTRLLMDLAPPRTGASSPAYLGVATDSSGKTRALYAAWEGNAQQSLWGSDGTSRGTAPIRTFVFQDDAGGATLDGIVYFVAADQHPNYELWRSDGTTAGTWQVADIFPLPGWYGVHSDPVVAGGRLYFVAEDLEHGPELWTSDGTEAGTRMVLDHLPGPEGSYPNELVVAGDTLFFMMFDEHGRELWTSDGTEAGTHMVKDIARTSSGHCCSRQVPFNGRLLFEANDGVHGTEPWVSDGTEEGTFLLKDIVAGSASSFYRETAVIGEAVFFQINDGVHGIELWKSDGTEAGTVMVRDIRPGPESAFPSFLGPVGDALVFTTLDPLGRGWEVWRSDGSEAGTTPLGVFLPEDARFAGTFEGGVLFSETDFEGRGLELWRTDGTTEGTAFVQDIAPGPAWSDPRMFVPLGTRVLFEADDPTANRELFAGRTAILLGQPERALADLKDEVRGLGLPRGIETSLLAKLQPAENALAKGRAIEAVVGIENFVRHLEAQSRHIEADETADLVMFARDLVTLLETERPPQPAPPPKAPRQHLDP